jgi:membrane associated rhomboid family serine protease
MPDVSTFGKKKTLRAPTAPAKPSRPPEPVEVFESAEHEASASGIIEFLTETRVPFLALALMALLGVVFHAEHMPGDAFGVAFGGMGPPLYAQGALSAKAVYAGEWWRLFTAPLLHGGMIDLVGNLVSLFIAGWIFERLIGRAWFGALFVICALGGSIGCLLLNAPDMLASGASGAILGVLAATFICSFLFEAVQLRKRMQRGSLQLLVPSLLTVMLPFFSGGHPENDYGTPIGGTVTGALLGWVLLCVWPETAPRPNGGTMATAMSAAGGMLAALSFMAVVNRL